MNDLDVMAFADDMSQYCSDDEELEEGDCGGEHCGVIGCPSCDREYYENFPCGKGSDGQCSMAGTEECDFECPNS